MDYRELLEHSYKVASGIGECQPESRLEYLTEYIFDFTTYDTEMSVLFARKAVEVCEAINNGTTFDYIEDSENYRWFLMMCNMPFFAEKLDWGSSIRGAWWSASPESHIEFESHGLWIEHGQLDALRFSIDEWKLFIAAVIEFARCNVSFTE